MTFIKKTGIFILYMLPCLIVLSVQLSNYFRRICEDDDDKGEYLSIISMMDDEEYNDSESSLFSAEGQLDSVKRLEIVRRFKKMRRMYKAELDSLPAAQQREKSRKADIYRFKIWKENSVIIGVMVILPFLVFALRLAYDKRLERPLKERLSFSLENWMMKAIVAGVIGIGWMYVLNPYGRAATTFYQCYLLHAKPPINTLPLYVSTLDISPSVAAFLGWYLNLLFYVFTKLYHNDVTSSRIYRFLFLKLLFSYGLALVATPVLGPHGKLAMFLIGFFPVSALNMLKKLASRTLKNTENSNDDLSVLPGMSNWAILRIQEEGVGNITSLATMPDNRILNYFPRQMVNLLYLWVDAAKLYTVLGLDVYQKIGVMCKTASEFTAMSQEPSFRNWLREVTEIQSPEMIVERLNIVFPKVSRHRDSPQ